MALPSYLPGVALHERRTPSLAPGAPARIGAILTVLVFVPEAWMSGDTRGVAALLGGFVIEAAILWWFVHARAPAHPLAGGR